MVGKLKVDRGIPSDLGRVAEVARAHEAAGYDGCWTGEINNDPFFPLLLAAEHTSTLEVGTSIAVAFARNRAGDVVHHAEAADAFALSFAQGGQGFFLGISGRHQRTLTCGEIR